MSILIKGAKMPKECEYCMLAGFGGAEYEYYVCMFNGKWKGRDSHGRMESCPLVEIPPHGDLIDVDNLIQDIEELDNKPLIKWLKRFVNGSAVVIESEEQDHEYRGSKSDI